MNEYLDYDIERLIVIVHSLLDELRLIKRRSYFRRYYRKNRALIKERIRVKKRELVFASNPDKPPQPYVLTFD